MVGLAPSSGGASSTAKAWDAGPTGSGAGCAFGDQAMAVRQAWCGRGSVAAGRCGGAGCGGVLDVFVVLVGHDSAASTARYYGGNGVNQHRRCCHIPVGRDVGVR